MGMQPGKLVSTRGESNIIRDYWPVIVAGLLFIICNIPAFKDWWAIWNEKDSYYSHGFLVPLIAGFMVWINRRRLASTPISHTWIGIVLLLAFLPIHIIGHLMSLRVLYGIAFFLCIYGTLLLMFGWRITKLLFVPVLFLLTMIPVATWILDGTTAKLQLVSASVATQFLKTICFVTNDSGVTQSGNYIISSALPGDHRLLVGSPCSGLKLLISLFTFCWFFIYVIEGSKWKKAFLFSLSLPLSIFINSLRITMIGCVGMWTGSSEAMHKFHDYSGYIGLVVCFFILFGIAKLIKLGDFRLDEPAFGAQPVKAWPKPVGGSLYGIIVAVILLIAAASSTLVSPLYNLPKGKLDRQSIPMEYGAWTGNDLEIDKGTAETLAKGDLLSRMFVDRDSGRQVHVFMDASLDIMAFHSPLLCLPGSGNEIVADREITVSFKEPRPITVRATVLELENSLGNTLIIYWYMLGDKSCPRTENVAQINRQNKLNDLKRVALNPFGMPELREQINSRQFTWYRFSTEKWDDGHDEEFLQSFIKEFIANVDSFGK